MAAYFSRYLLPLHIHWKKSGKPYSDVLTGWLLFDHAPRGQLVVWVTAGHVVHLLRKMLADTTISGLSAAWCDRYPHPDANQLGVDLRQLSMFAIDNNGTDIGIIAIPRLHVENFARNPQLTPITSDFWANKDAYRPRGYFIIGFPQEEQRVRTWQSGRVWHGETSMAVFALPMKRIPTKPRRHSLDTFWGHESALYGRRMKPTGARVRVPSHLRGMSGGLIVSVRKTREGINCHLWGIQSAILEGTPFVRATRIEVLDALLRHARQADAIR